MVKLHTPISMETIKKLRVGDVVSFSGIMITARDAAHKFLVEKYIDVKASEEIELYEDLKRILREGVIYHCGPIVSKTNGSWHFVAAGPTTSIREEPFQGKVIQHFQLRAVIGKGGMGPATLKACQDFGCVYLHAVGGAAAVIGSTITQVHTVFKLEEFGSPEAMWVIESRDFPAVVTMDSYGKSLHKEIEELSETNLKKLLGL